MRERTSSCATLADLQTFLDNYVCEANKNGSEYFFFQYQNNDWAGEQYGSECTQTDVFVLKGNTAG